MLNNINKPPRNFEEFLKWSRKNKKQEIEIEKEKVVKLENFNKSWKFRTDGVIIYKDDSGTIFHKNYNFFLRLKSERKPRELGFVSTDANWNKVFITKRSKSQHLFRKFNAWWFNYQVLNYLVNTFWKINLQVDEKEEWKTYVYNWFDKEKFEEYKKKYILNFKQQGFELQVFIPLKDFN